MKYISGLGNDLKPNETPGMDSSVVATRFPGLFQVSTTDFFYPLVEDPYLQGRIACCNVLSDMYAMAVTEIDTMLMLVGVSRDMTEGERDIVTTAMMKGFNDTATAAGTNVTGGQTVLNPWPIIGGVAMSLQAESDFIRPDGIVPGDVLVLTKPLGTQVAVNYWQWRGVPKYWDRLTPALQSPELAGAAYSKACESMGRLNLAGARCMKAHGARGGTDVTGFGILGHAQNLAEHASTPVLIELTSLPIIAGMVAVDAAMGSMFHLLEGLSAETSGGLLVALPAASVDAFIRDVQAADGQPAWVVGRVLALPEGETTGRAVIAEGVAVIDV